MEDINAAVEKIASHSDQVKLIYCALKPSIAYHLLALSACFKVLAALMRKTIIVL